MRSAVAIAAALATVTLALPLGAQDPLTSAAERTLPPVTVLTNIPPDRFLARDETIVVELSRALDPATERVAVFVADTDVTALFDVVPDGMRYVPGVLPLPGGESDVVVYLVTENGWHEVGRAVLKVAGRLGVTGTRIAPSLDAGLKSRLGFGRVPELPAPDRSTWNDVDGKFGLETEVVHVRGASIVARSAVVGTSHRESRLRFREKGIDAPLLDLSSYLLQAEKDGLRLAVGHVSAGNQRHLIDRFSSRGTTVSYASGTRIDASLAALHGNSTVGWSDLLGGTQSDHRVLNATLGVEALPRPGALRVELSALDGSVLPLSGFNSGAVTDAEQSRGVAVRVQANGLGSRLRLDAGFSRSAFDNPPDPLLSQGIALVPVARESRDARYLETSLDVLRGMKLPARRTARLTLGLAHERVDPLFRTVATFTRADHVQNRVELRGDIAGVSVSANHARSGNNLEGVPSILTTLTHRSGLDVRVPVATVVGARPSGWWPSLSYRLDRTHQFGETVPLAGGFDPSHVPDQVSDNLTVGAEWRWRRVSVAYQLNRSLQDNRQPGRENADLENVSNGVNVTITPAARLSLSAGITASAAENIERAETERTQRLAATLNWRPLREGTLALQFSDTQRENDSRGSTRADRSYSSQWSSPVPGLARFGGKWQLRFARSLNDARDTTLNLDQRRRDWSLDSGLNFRFF